MVERRSESSDETQQDPGQRALERLERQISSTGYNSRELEQALNGVTRVGDKIWSSPGEMYVALAQFSDSLAQNAEKHGKEGDVTKFTERKQQFEMAGERLERQPEGSASLSKPSSPRRTTGRAAG